MNSGEVRGACVVLVRGAGPIGAAIRGLTGAPVNHALIAYQDPAWGGWWGAQVDEHGVRALPIERVFAKGDHHEAYRVRADLGPGLRALRHYVGARYDWAGIAGFLAKLTVWRLTGRRVANPLQDHARMFCSEFVAAVLVAAGAATAAELPPASTAPGDLRTFMRARPGAFQALPAGEPF